MRWMVFEEPTANATGAVFKALRALSTAGSTSPNSTSARLSNDSSGSVIIAHESRVRASCSLQVLGWISALISLISDAPRDHLRQARGLAVFAMAHPCD